MQAPEHIKHLVIMLNDLAIINNDRIEGYKKAEKQAGDNDLRSLFREKFNQSEEFMTDLKVQITQLGGTYTMDTSFAGKIFRAWMGIKNTFKPNDATSILDSCEFGETAAVKAYDEVLRSDVEIPASVRQQILEQQTAIKKSHDTIKKYGDLNLNFFNYNKSFTS